MRNTLLEVLSKMAKRITCKVHDMQQRVVQVGVEGEGVRQMLEVWGRIRSSGEGFYTYERQRHATVRAIGEYGGKRYLTTYADGITDNNLDELRTC